MPAAIKNAGNSAPVSSNQAGPHARLEETVLRHYRNAWCEPLHKPSQLAFEELQSLLNPREPDRLILDSGCGTGTSTLALAELHPGSMVIGIDRSAARLRRIPGGSLAIRKGNCIWLRSRLETFWRLAYGAQWRVEKNYLLYPNPWPKSEQLKKRWHAHPVFPIVLALSGTIELRSNWRIYAEEFAAAMAFSGRSSAGVERFNPEYPISPFEKKYVASGHQLWRVCSS
jgi:tRNA G46 methylase TrmB